jgi:SAM-dependent methyltransferase
MASPSVRELAAAWDRRVEQNRAQVERFRQVPEAVDFYAPVSAHFSVDPDRTDDPVVDALRARARPDDTWLDIGAGAGRFALPLARTVHHVLAVEPSAAMLAGLRAGMEAHGIGNVTIIEQRWPPDGPPPGADVALIAHVGYDVAPIGPFLDAMDAAARRECVAVLMETAPASYADPFWPVIHGQARSPLPALPEMLDLLRARGAVPVVLLLPRQARHWPDDETLLTMLRHQLWIEPGSASDARLVDEVRRRVLRDEEGVSLPSAENRVGVVHWSPPEAPLSSGRD